MNRQQRRAQAARRRGIFRKHTPFGRVKVTNVPTDGFPYLIYNHFTKGVVVRRETLPLLQAMWS